MKWKLSGLEFSCRREFKTRHSLCTKEQVVKRPNRLNCSWNRTTRQGTPNVAFMHDMHDGNKADQYNININTHFDLVYVKRQSFSMKVEPNPVCTLLVGSKISVFNRRVWTHVGEGGGSESKNKVILTHNHILCNSFSMLPSFYCPNKKNKQVHSICYCYKAFKSVSTLGGTSLRITS